MSSAEQTEAIERTLSELEAQHAAAQQVLAEALAELESLYAEIEEYAQAADAPLAEPPNPAVEGRDPAAEERIEQLQQELDEVRLQRDELREQLAQAQSQAAAAPPSPPGDGTDDDPNQAVAGDKPLGQVAPQHPALIAPFETLRRSLQHAAVSES